MSDQVSQSPRLTRTIRVNPSVYQVQLAILRYEDGSWALAVEFWYWGQKHSTPTRLVLPEGIAKSTLFGNPIAELPYRSPISPMGGL